MPIVHFTLEHIEKFDARVLENRIDLGFFRERTHIRLHRDIFLAHCVTKKLVLMACPGTSAFNLESLTGANKRYVPLLIEFSEERRDGDMEGTSQGKHGRDRWKNEAILNLRQGPAREPNLRRKLMNRQSELLTE